jgi:hypothetical protein
LDEHTGGDCLVVVLTVAGENDERKGIADDPFQNASKDLEHPTKEEEQSAVKVNGISR